MHNQRISVTERVMDIVHHNPGCLLEELFHACRGLSWNQVFAEVDRLSRNGQIRLRRQGMGNYAVSMPGYEKMNT